MICKSRIPLLALLTTGLMSAHAELHIPAFTAYDDPKPDAVHFGKEGVTGWTDPSQKILWFGEIAKPGEIEASVSLKLPPGTVSKLKLTVDGVSHEASVTGADGLVTATFGKYEIKKAGYSRFALESLNPSGKPAGDLHELILDGPATDEAHFNVEERRNAASVHLAYPTPKGADIAAFYVEATGVEDPVATYYMAAGFNRGYFGMQVNSPTERRIIFSIWDSGAGGKANKRDEVAKEDQTQLVAKGEGVFAGGFGNEGTGGHSHLVYPWKTGSKQKFLVTVKPTENDSAIYAGYWFHPEKKAWMLIASFKAPKAKGSLSGLYSFSENFGGSNGYLQRKALFGNQWIQLRDGTWQEITEASFSHDPTGKAARLDRFMGVENGQFFLSNGGFVSGFTKFGEHFTRPATGVKPSLENLPEPK